jgi:hypothetical protein
VNPVFRHCQSCAAAHYLEDEATWDGPKKRPSKKPRSNPNQTIICVRRSAGTWKEVKPEDGCFDSLPIPLTKKENPF